VDPEAYDLYSVPVRVETRGLSKLPKGASNTSNEPCREIRATHRRGQDCPISTISWDPSTSCPRRSRGPKRRPRAERAIQLDETLSEGHVSLGSVLLPRMVLVGWGKGIAASHCAQPEQRHGAPAVRLRAQLFEASPTPRFGRCNARLSWTRSLRPSETPSPASSTGRSLRRSAAILPRHP